MNGRWRVGPVGSTGTGRPWLLLRGGTIEATPVERAGADARPRPGAPARPGPPRRGHRSGRRSSSASAAPTRARPLGEVLQDQRLVAGIGNMWMSETLWAVGLSPWLPVAAASDDELAGALRWSRDRHARLGRRRARAALRLPARRTAVRPLRDADRVAWSGRRQPHRLLVPGVPAAVTQRFGRPPAGYAAGMTATTLALSPRYRGIEPIASGGMSDVYVATDDSLDRQVAIKVLNERFAGDPEIRSRFTREARIAARLSIEPNVVTIFDVADVAGRPAIVMEFLPGGTLADRMRAGRIAPALALAWLEQAATGARRGPRRRRRPSRRQAGEPDARRRRRRPCDGLRDCADRRGRLVDERRHDSRHVRLHVAGAGRRRHGDGRERSLRARRRRLRAAQRPQALPGGHLRRGGGRARDRPDPAGDRLRPLAASGDRRRFRPRSREGSSRALSVVRRTGRRPARCLLRERRHDRPDDAADRRRAAAAAAVRARGLPRRPGRCGGARRRRGPWRCFSRAPSIAAGEAAPPTTVVQDDDRRRTATGANGDRRGAARRVAWRRAGRARSPCRRARSGAALNDQGFRLLRSGDAAAALPLLERAVGAAPGHRLADRGLRLVQPRRRSLLDRRLQRRQGSAPPLRADPGQARTRSRISEHAVGKGCKR